jgi:hypothetical protein
VGPVALVAPPGPTGKIFVLFSQKKNTPASPPRVRRFQKHLKRYDFKR